MSESLSREIKPKLIIKGMKNSATYIANSKNVKSTQFMS